MKNVALLIAAVVLCSMFAVEASAACGRGGACAREGRVGAGRARAVSRRVLGAPVRAFGRLRGGC